MGNVIQIKRGQGAPQTGTLQPYELGFDTASGVLYIGTPSGQAVPVFAGGEATTSASLPSTRLLKPKDNKADNQVLQVYCYNLQPGTQYVLELYTMQKSRGNASRYWRHPANLNPDDPTIDWTREMGQYTGYKNLVGQQYGNDDYDYYYEEPPQWMDNGGILVSEWELPLPEETTMMFEINLNSWISDLLKYHPQSDLWTLMGVHSGDGRRKRYARWFQFRIRTPLGAVGPTENTLHIGATTASSEGDVSIGFCSIK